MSACGDAPCESLTLDRYMNLLLSGSKREKKKALDDLTKIAKEAEGEMLLEVHGKLQNQLILCFQDPMETVRESALALSKLMIERLAVDKVHISLLIPSLYARVCHRDDRETSEELRLLMAEFLITLVDRYDKHLTPYVTEMVDMVCNLLKDPSPEIKQTSSRLVVILVKSLPNETFQFTNKLWRPLVENITHQRWRVRVATIEAIEWVMLKGDNKCVPEVTPALNKKMLDSMYQVRMALVKLAGHWLVKLPDRYSFFAHLIPMVLSGLADDNKDVVREAQNLWEEAGDVYLQENDKELKDKINYEPEILEHYPPGVKRPSLGCRILIDREASKFLLALANELTDWVEIVRIKAAILLTQVTLHFEQSITMSIRKIITQICKAARDRECPLVVANVKLAAEYMGYFVPADVYCKLILEYMKEAHEGELLIAAALVRGTRRSDLLENLDTIATLMENPTFNGNEQLALLDLVESVMKISRSDCFVIGDSVWAVLVCIAGLAEGGLIQDKAIQLLDEFAILGGGNKMEIYSNHCLSLLKKLSEAVWTVHCREQYILTAIVNVTGEIISDHLDMVLQIFKNALQPDIEPEVLLKIMMTVNALLDNTEITLASEAATGKFVRSMLSEILPVHLKWSAGRKAEALRTAGCTCLFMCLSKISSLPDDPASESITITPLPTKNTIAITDISELPPSGMNFEKPNESLPNTETSSASRVIHGLGGYIEPLLPLLMSLIQDPSPKTRLLALNCVKIFSTNPVSHKPENCSTIISQVIKRLDDADNNVRATAVEVIACYYATHLKLASKDTINRTLAAFVFSTLLIHLDDKDPVLKRSILNCLQTVSSIDPRTLRGKVFPNNFIDKKICQELIDSLEEMIENTAISE